MEYDYKTLYEKIKKMLYSYEYHLRKGKTIELYDVSGNELDFFVCEWKDYEEMFSNSYNSMNIFLVVKYDTLNKELREMMESFKDKSFAEIFLTLQIMGY